MMGEGVVAILGTSPASASDPDSLGIALAPLWGSYGPAGGVLGLALILAGILVLVPWGRLDRGVAPGGQDRSSEVRGEDQLKLAIPLADTLSALEAFLGNSEPAQESARATAQKLHEILCRYLRTLRPGLGASLTTPEILEALRGGLPMELMEKLEGLLGALDQIRFGGQTGETGYTRWLADELSRWVREADEARVREPVHA
jgi:hypothetical protein